MKEEEDESWEGKVKFLEKSIEKNQSILQKENTELKEQIADMKRQIEDLKTQNVEAKEAMNQNMLEIKDILREQFR